MRRCYVNGALNLERDQLILDREEQARASEQHQVQQQRELGVCGPILRTRSGRDRPQAAINLRKTATDFSSIICSGRCRNSSDTEQFRREQQLARTREEQTREQILLHRRRLTATRAPRWWQQSSSDGWSFQTAGDGRPSGAEGATSFGPGRLGDERVRRKPTCGGSRTCWLHAENLETRRQRLDRLRASSKDQSPTLERLAVGDCGACNRRPGNAGGGHEPMPYSANTRHTRVVDRAASRLEQALRGCKGAGWNFRTNGNCSWVDQQAGAACREQVLLRSRSDRSSPNEWRTLAERRTTKLQAESTIRDLLRRLSERDVNEE